MSVFAPFYGHGFAVDTSVANNADFNTISCSAFFIVNTSTTDGCFLRFSVYDPLSNPIVDEGDFYLPKSGKMVLSVSRSDGEVNVTPEAVTDVIVLFIPGNTLSLGGSAPNVI